MRGDDGSPVGRSMLDGARNALLGYLYQFVGTATISAPVEASEDEWTHLIARIGPGEVASEEFGQDAVLHPPATLESGVTAIQFKHSSIATSQIDVDELIDILVAFERSQNEVIASGNTIEHFELVTNRSLAPKAQEIADCGACLAPHPGLTVKAERSGKPVARNVKRLKSYGGDSARAAQAWHAIVRRLRVCTGATLESGLNRLRYFARQYGVHDEEWEEGLKKLLAALITETTKGGSVRMTQAWLKTHLIGDPEAADLQFNSASSPRITKLCRARLEERARQQHRIAPELYLERRVQQELGAALEQHTVVFVAGGGGCGKSLAVLNYLQSIADSQVVWSAGANTAGEEELVAELTRARVPGKGHVVIDRHLRDFRARLDVANEGRQSVWTIDIDGIDEAPDRSSQIRKLINLCWAGGHRDASPASLVVTCRAATGSREKEVLIATWFDVPEPDLVEGVGFLRVGDFVEQELEDAARLLNGAPEQRIIRSLAAPTDAALSHEPLVPEELLRTLRHPVVWGGYASLPEPDRIGVLNQQTCTFARLAERVYTRFLLRCRVRRRWRDELMLERALPIVAREHQSLAPTTPEQWDRACQQYLSETEGRILYAECLSYGIITRDGRNSWRWVHEFLVNYLANLAGGDAGE